LGNRACGMSRTQLGDERKSGAYELVNALTADGIVVDTAFWTFVEQLDEWRLIIISPDVPRVGSRDILMRIDKKLMASNGSASFSLFDLTVHSSDDPHVIEWLDNVGILTAGITYRNTRFNNLVVSEVFPVFSRNWMLGGN
ncbi:MAG: hypothetical protein KDC32_15585, partial [Saprospiraceae bacterium]|nr:hypothetical protein [Saprospiraceae bacterium]